MLVLTFEVEEGVEIGDDITIRVLKVHDGRVTLGIDAPRRVPILREELDAAAKAALRERCRWLT